MAVTENAFTGYQSVQANYLQESLPLLELAWCRAEKTTGLFAGSTRRCEAEHFLDVLPDRHRAENVQEDKGTFRVVITGQVSMTQSLDPRDWHKW